VPHLPTAPGTGKEVVKSKLKLTIQPRRFKPNFAG